MSENRLSNLIDILNYSAKLLEEKGVEDSRLNAELLMSKVLGCSRLELYLNFDKPLNENEKEKFKILLRRRLKREPLQYILGYTEFHRYRFDLNNKVLIPRPETELLVELTLNFILNNKLKDIKILDAGTGSGCIAISLTKELSDKEVVHHITAVDVSEDALILAKNNSIYNKADTDSLSFKSADIFNGDFSFKGFDIVVSNPPYISKEEYEKLEPELRYFEPVISLTDYKDGLTFYRRFFELINNSDSVIKCFVETGYNQKENLEKIALNYNINDFIFHKDYNGVYRIMEITK